MLIVRSLVFARSLVRLRRRRSDFVCVTHRHHIAMEGIGQQHGETDPEQGRGEHTGMFDITADWEWLRRCSIVAHRALHVLVEGKVR